MTMRIAVATDGQPAALGALRVAAALAARHGAPVEVVGAVPPVPVSPALVGAPTALPLVELDRAALDAVRERVTTQVAELGGEASGWHVTVELGMPARTIVELAHDRQATLLVLGLGRHELVDRWFGSETALQVARLAHVPVLAVPADARELPAVAVAAVDFTDFSRDAAETATGILRPGGTLHLAHVSWRPTEEVPWVGGADWIEEHRDRLRAQLQALAARLQGMHGVEVRTSFLEGDPATEVQRLAGELGADLVAAGSHGTGFFGRLVMGSVSTRLLRHATAMVLIAPPRTLPGELERRAGGGAAAEAAAAPLAGGVG